MIYFATVSMGSDENAMWCTRDSRTRFPCDVCQYGGVYILLWDEYVVHVMRHLRVHAINVLHEDSVGCGG